MVKLFAQIPDVVTSLTWLMRTVPGQLSVATMAVRLMDGTSDVQVTVTSNDPDRVVITGAILSFTVIVCIKLLKLPQASVAQ